MIKRKDLDLSEKILYAVMDRLGALEKPIYPRQQWLADRLGLSLSDIKKILKRLENKGFIKREGKK